MAEAQTWRIDTGDRVREVVVTSVHRGLWRCEDGPRETSPVAAVRAYAHFDGRGGMPVAPGEMTRAELAARLATATASVRQLRADVELATAQRDAETCRADNTEGERDEARAALAAVTAERDAALEECSTLRRGLDHADGVIDEIREVLGAADDEGAVVAAERVTAERDALRAERDGLRDRLTDEQIAAAEARRRVLAHDRLRQMAEGQRDALRAEHAADCDLIVRQGSILAAVADALKGPPPALSSHSHHDLGAVAAATVAQQAPLVACVDALRAAARDAGWRDADATGETLVAWVRRGEREACAVRCDAIYTERDDAARKRRKYGTQNTCDGDCARLAGQAQGAAMCVEAIREGGE